MFVLLLALACTGGDDSGEPVDCEVIEGSVCGNAAAQQGEDTACPEGYTCWGPSAFQCFRGDECELPICLPAVARIDTPRGPVPVAELTLADTVYSLDGAGERVEVAIARLGSTAAPADHALVLLNLADGRSISASPGHPAADGRRLGDLAPGDPLDGSVVATTSLVPYGASRTYDLLPDSPTGAYWADGVVVGSTLRAPRTVAVRGAQR